MRIGMLFVIIMVTCSSSLVAMMYHPKRTEELRKLMCLFNAEIMHGLFPPNMQSYLADRIQTYSKKVEQLVEKCANPHHVSFFAAIHFAAFTNNSALLRLIIEQHNVPVDSADRDNRTALGYAVRGSALEALQLLISYGADVNYVERTRDTCFTPLMYARDAILEKLLDNNANIEAQCTLTGQTPLICAIRRRDKTVVQTLIDRGANLEHTMSDGSVPIFDALQQEGEDILLLLMKNGANVYSMDNEGKTIRNFTAEFSVNAIVESLFKEDYACPNLGSLTGEDKNTQNIFAYLQDVAISDETPLTTSIRLKSSCLLKAVVDELVKQNLLDKQLNSQDTFGFGPLFYATLLRNAEGVEILLANGAHAVFPDNALMLAHKIIVPNDESSQRMYNALARNLALSHHLLLFKLEILPKDIRFLIINLAIMLSLEENVAH